MNAYEKILAEYPKDYCCLLEEAYGKKMMSEGGSKAIDNMFRGFELAGKNLLDFGFGLGGVAYYLAENHDVNVTGIEINPWMVEKANQHIPEHLESKLNFVHYSDVQSLPLGDNTFDIIYSKGVLTHIHNKKPLFQEFYRILKPGSQLIIDDWLSPIDGEWGKDVLGLCELENLSLFAVSEQEYKDVLRATGFINISSRNENSNYHQYNLEIIERLKTILSSDQDKAFSDKEYSDSIIGYQLIADAIANEQLLIRNIIATKNL